MKIFKVFVSSTTAVSSVVDYPGVPYSDVLSDVEERVRLKTVVFTHKTKVIGTEPEVKDKWVTKTVDGYSVSFRSSITVSSSFFVESFSVEEAKQKVLDLQSKKKIVWNYGPFTLDFDSNSFDIFISEKKRSEVSITTSNFSVIDGVLTPIEGSPDRHNEFVLRVNVSTSGEPEGYVVVREGGTELTRAFVINGSAEMRGFFSAGSHAFSVEYSGSPLYFPKSAQTTVNFTNGALVNPADYNLTIYLDGSEYDFVGDFWNGKPSLGRSADMFVDGYGTNTDAAPNATLVPRSGPGFGGYHTMFFGSLTDWFDADLVVDGQEQFLFGTVIFAVKINQANSSFGNSSDGPVLFNAPSSFRINSYTTAGVNHIIFAMNNANVNVDYDVGTSWNLFTMRFNDTSFEVRRNGGAWTTINNVSAHVRSNTRIVAGGIHPVSGTKVDLTYGGIRASAQYLNEVDVTALELELASKLGL